MDIKRAPPPKKKKYILIGAAAAGLVIITLPRLIRTLELIKKERAEQSKKLVAQGLED